MLSHNLIRLQDRLMLYPDGIFLAAPIILVISAMTILYGKMSRRSVLPDAIFTEDIDMTIRILSRRRSVHALLVRKVAERVFAAFGSSIPT